MIFSRFMENFAREINGQFSQYDNSKSLIIIPLQDDRFQTIVGLLRLNETQDREGIAFSSKVCQLRPDIQLDELLRANAKFGYARFVLVEDAIKVEAAVYLDTVTEGLLKEVILEVARVADEWERKLTGVDIY